MGSLMAQALDTSASPAQSRMQSRKGRRRRPKSLRKIPSRTQRSSSISYGTRRGNPMRATPSTTAPGITTRRRWSRRRCRCWPRQKVEPRYLTNWRNRRWEGRAPIGSSTPGVGLSGDDRFATRGCFPFPGGLLRAFPAEKRKSRRCP